MMVPLYHQVFSVLLLFSVISRSVSAEGCFVPDTTWDADVNQGISNVTTKVSENCLLLALLHFSYWQEECQAICSESSSSCRGFTFYNATASPHGNYCEIYPSIHSSTPCSNCVSGPSSCLCSGKFYENAVSAPVSQKPYQ